MDTIRAQYERHAADAASDIHEHLPVLRALAAAHCRSAAELGVRDVVATWALLLGLAESPSGERTLYGMDLERPAPGALWAAGLGSDDAPEALGRLGEAVGVRYRFLRGDSARTPLPAPVDLLFVDTWHVYGHLRRELALHEPRALRWIVLHDTETDRVQGESVRLGLDVAAQSRASGYPADEIRRGLGPAITEFLARHRGRWVVERHFPGNNGLTVLRRLALGPVPPAAVAAAPPAGSCLLSLLLLFTLTLLVVLGVLGWRQREGGR